MKRMVHLAEGGVYFAMWVGGQIQALIYRAEKKSLQILLSRTQAGPGRKVKQEQEEISRNHVPRLFLGSVVYIISQRLFFY